MLFRKVTKDVRIYVQKCVDSGKEINLTYAVKAKTISQARTTATDPASVGRPMQSPT